jgi:hypothetical protein
MSEARPFPLSRLPVLGSRFSWSDVVDAGVLEGCRDDCAVEGAAFMRAMSHECKEVMQWVCKKVAWNQTAGRLREVVCLEGR